jgi:hypothetical protein
VSGSRKTGLSREQRTRTLEKYAINHIISHYRSRIEHVNRAFEHHQIFQEKYRGEINNLFAAIILTANVTNIDLHWNLRYQVVGPWSHWPE